MIYLEYTSNFPEYQQDNKNTVYHQQVLILRWMVSRVGLPEAEMTKKQKPAARPHGRVNCSWTDGRADVCAAALCPDDVSLPREIM
jgi:hypothetical protein